MKATAYLNRFQAGAVRPIALPGGIQPTLENLYQYGQNDFQPIADRCSVSVGDVIRVTGDLSGRYNGDWLVLAVGFCRLPVGLTHRVGLAAGDQADAIHAAGAGDQADRETIIKITREVGPWRLDDDTRLAMTEEELGRRAEFRSVPEPPRKLDPMIDGVRMTGAAVRARLDRRGCKAQILTVIKGARPVALTPKERQMIFLAINPHETYLVRWDGKNGNTLTILGEEG
ncbi:MAG: hypothetical protein GWO44_18285 [Thermoplasmata archaeon]|nr:hypothetical protein [Thermoplasmata archaeon]NIY05148.1 hypothetical protein [Thermoplasmata archaeon]